MSRRINTVSLQAGDGTPTKPDGYTDRIVKLIPADVVAGWLAVTSALASATHKLGPTGLWIAFAVGAVFAFLWTLKQASEKNKKTPWIQAIVSTFAFAVWAYATGGVAPKWPGPLYDPAWATILLVVFSLASGLVTAP